MNKKYIICTAFLLIVLSTSYLALRNNQNNKENTNSLSTQSIPTQIQTPTPIPTQTPKPVSEVNMYFIALEDNGASGKKIGCNDSVVAVKQTIESTTVPLKQALTSMLNYKNDYYGESGFYNALAKSNLTVKSANVVDQIAIIKLEGDYTLGGTCDAPRFSSQLEETVLQFSTIKTVQIFINDQPLDTLLSQQ